MLVTLLTQSVALAFDVHVDVRAPGQGAGDPHHHAQTAFPDASRGSAEPADATEAASAGACDYCGQCVQSGSHAGLLAEYVVSALAPVTNTSSTLLLFLPVTHPDTPYRPPIA